MQWEPVIELIVALIQPAHARERFLLQGLRSSIPPNFPYFSAEIGLSSGHVHVIDKEADFDNDFGRGVLVGLLQLPAEMMHKKAKQESQSIQVGPHAENFSALSGMFLRFSVRVGSACGSAAAVCRDDAEEGQAEEPEHPGVLPEPGNSMTVAIACAHSFKRPGALWMNC